MNRACFILLFFSLALSPISHAVSIGGIEVPEQRGGLKLQGAGLLRKGFFFKIYVGALYLENTAQAGEPLENRPKRIDIHYFHHTPKKYMIRAANDTLEKNLTDDEFNRLKPMIDQLHMAYKDGESDACASMIHRPGEGLTYLFQDKKIITIPDDHFANAYFGIWLGENPSSRTMKRAMLGYENNSK